ncbi:putative nuclease HARBI1 [Sitophilus oryzae]|uniref:Nuclease HARBI1 n=1 Tax=Sitophilus oryzae TaxID=7048 RepID=A0A6J2XDS5_SITOR|nr:putative nuclease HARBI1 [Sitophilus oryzae]
MEQEIFSGDLRGISQQSVSLRIRMISKEICRLLPEYIQHPGLEQKRRNVRLFQAIAGFPGVAACIDCTHIKIVSPGGDNAEVFRNRKGIFSLNVQVAVGPQMEMLDIVVRHPGSAHDSVIFDRSALRVFCERGQMGGFLLGDNGYPCRPYLLTPVIHPGNVRDERYNRAHKSTRNIVERVFGVYKRRFPCLYRGLTTKLETTQAIICATATLYNLGVKCKDNFIFEDEVAENIDDDIGNINVPLDQLGLGFRNEFIQNHF